MDIGLEYYLNETFSVFGNYSYISENMFETVIKGTDGQTGLNTISTPKNKFRLGANYGGGLGWRANLSFQHDDAFLSFDGQFAGQVDEKNLVDLGIGYKFDFGLTVNAGAQNLFNNEYRAYPNMPKIGRRSSITLTYDFGGGER